MLPLLSLTATQRPLPHWDGYGCWVLCSWKEACQTGRLAVVGCGWTLLNSTSVNGAIEKIKKEVEESLGPSGEVHRPAPEAPQRRLGASSIPKSGSTPFATDLPSGKPAWGATARLRRCAPATPGQCSAPAAHVGHLPPSGTPRRVGCWQQVRPGQLRGNAETRESGTRPVQLHAEPQAQQQGSTEQPPGQDSAAAPGRPGCGHDWDPGLRLQSGSHPQLRDAKTEASPLAPGCQLWQLPSGPRMSARLPLCHRGGPGVTLSCPAGRATGGGLGAHPGDSHRETARTRSWGAGLCFHLLVLLLDTEEGGKVSCQVLHQRKVWCH